MDNRITIGVVDDHPIVREGICAILSMESDFHIVGEAGTAREALEQFRSHRPKILILDLVLPDSHGLDVAKEICSVSASTQIIILTSMCGDEDIYRALQAGVRGYLFKDAARKELVTAIRTVSQGKQYISPQVGAALAEGLPRTALSPREVEVLKLVAVGQRNKEIAFTLNITEATVNAHVKHILEKLGASDRTEAATIALRRGIIRL